MAISDFGTEVGNSAVQITGNILAKVLDALLKLFKALFEHFIIHAKDRAINNMKLSQMKDDAAQKKFLESIDGKVGYVNYNELMKAHVPLTVTGLTMTKDEMKDFAAHCKREHILFTAVLDSRELVLNKNNKFAVLCKESDLERIKNIIDLMNEEKQISAREKRIEEILSKGEDNLTFQDITDINLLYKEISDIRRRDCYKFNDEQTESVIDSALHEDSKSSISFDEALNRITGRHINKDVTYFVADATDPSKYIKCYSHMDTFHHKPYIKTEYEVYKDKELILKADDGRFDGRPKNYWDTVKSTIKEKGGIGDLVLKFYSISEYENYLMNYTKKNEADLTPLHLDNVNRNYPEMCTALVNELSIRDAAYMGETVYDKNTKRALVLKPEMSEPERIEVAEAIVIGNQIKNYEQLRIIENSLSTAYSKLIETTDGTFERNAAISRFNAIKAEYDKAITTESKLIYERKCLNAVKAEHEIRVSDVIETTKIHQVHVDINFAAIRKELDNALNERGAVYYGGDAYDDSPGAFHHPVVIDKETHQEIAIKPDMPEEKQALMAETLIIGKQIEVYEHLAELKTQMNNLDKVIDSTPHDTLLYDSSIHKLDYVRTLYENDLSTANALIYERKSISDTQKADDRRTDRVTEIDDKKERTLSEYKGEIEDYRVKDGPKMSDFKDKAALDHDTESLKSWRRE